jgi:hypothetical protein
MKIQKIEIICILAFNIVVLSVSLFSIIAILGGCVKNFPQKQYLFLVMTLKNETKNLKNSMTENNNIKISKKEKEFYKKYGVDLEFVKQKQEQAKAKLYLNYVLNKN